MVMFLDPNQYFQVQVPETRESEDSDMEEINLMDALHMLEDNIWDPSPLTNPCLKIKMRQVAHSETMGILSLCHMLIEPASERYKKTYITMFKALVDKKVAEKTSDSRALTPSVSGLTQFLSKEDTDTTYQLNPNYWTTIPMEAQLPPTPLTPGIITFTDLLDNAMAQMNMPQCPDESDTLYNQHRNAVLRHAQQRAVQPEPHIKTEMVNNDIDSFTTHSQARGTNEPHPYTRTTPFHAPMNDDLQTRIVFQRLHNEDLASCGKSLYDDQGIVF
jgi:hypothetical protein